MDNFEYEEYTATAENVCLTLLLLKGNGSNNDIVGLTLHTHSYNEMFACVSGRITVITEYGEYSADSGETLFIPSGIKHRLKSQSNDARWCAFGFSFRKDRTEKTADIFGILSSEFVCPSVYKNCALKIYGLINGIHSCCLPALNLITVLLEMSYGANKPISTDIVSRLEYIIDSFFMQNINAETIADTLNISVRQLSRTVRKRYNDPLHSVICKKRLETSLKLLADTDRSIDEIYQEVGFTNKNSFFREFKKHYGTTPSGYRSGLRKK